MKDYVIWLDSLNREDTARVGGKNASLGEMIGGLARSGVRVPGGFATLASAYEGFLDANGLRDRIRAALDGLDVDDTPNLSRVGAEIRCWICDAALPPGLEEAVGRAYATLGGDAGQACPVAVRSSATAEDLPDASFAGQQETFLNVCGTEQVLLALRKVYASLYNDRAIAYRVHQGFDHTEVSISAGVQQMVRSDQASSGVMFTLDTESGFDDVVLITASYGLGELLVQGAVNPDEFYVYKPNLTAGRPAILRRTRGSKQLKMVNADSGGPETTRTVPVAESDQLRFCLDDTQVETLARQALAIEEHYGMPMDIEWAKDGVDGALYMLQARPETVRSRLDTQTLERFVLQQSGPVLATGRSIGQRIGAGPACVLAHASEMSRVKAGDVIVTDMTDPDWEPVMKRAAAVVTNRGGRTCHAAIIARELGIPAVVGTGDATEVLDDGQPVTVSCAQGDVGYIYAGELAYDQQSITHSTMPPVPVKLTMNVGNPDRAFEFAAIPNEGIGLARLEFIINRTIGIHPQALLDLGRLPRDVQQNIEQRIAGYSDAVSFYVHKLAEGIATLAAAFAPKPVIVRLSDFKSNEYSNMVGGDLFEPDEENPMLGFRGASRYLAEAFKPCFELECRAIKYVREDMGLTNVELMVPFVRTLDEARAVTALLAGFGLERGTHGLRIVMMCELPANAILADQFLEHFDGFSIGSNDLTQLTLGLDRDSGLVASQFDERDDAVKALMHRAIAACRRAKKYVGICGQGPSDYPDLAQWLMAQGIQSMSLNPDSIVETWLKLGDHADKREPRPPPDG